MTAEQRIYELSQLWKQVATVFPYLERVDGNLDDIYRDFLPRVLGAESNREQFLLLAEFLGRLKDGHTHIQPPAEIMDGYFPYKLRYIAGSYYVNGEEVLSINGVAFSQLLEQLFQYTYHVENYASPGQIQKFLPFFLKKKGNVLTTDTADYDFDLLEVPLVAKRPETVAVRSFGDVGYIALNDMLRPAAGEVEKAIRGKQAVILDIRENIGGMTKFGADVAGLFMAGEFSGCQKWTRLTKGIDLSSASQYAGMSEEVLAHYIRQGLCTREDAQRSMKIWRCGDMEHYKDQFQGQGIFDGPCVLLTSRDTVSAAEDFTAMFRSNRRATLIGEPTRGTTGTPLATSMASGNACVCSVGYKLLDGTEFIGRGILPDIFCQGDPKNPDRDPVLETALDFLKS